MTAHACASVASGGAVPPRTQRFRYHAIDLETGGTLGTFGSQREATEAVLHAGNASELAPGAVHHYAVRIESIASGRIYDVPLQVERQEANNFVW